MVPDRGKVSYPPADGTLVSLVTFTLMTRQCSLPPVIVDLMPCILSLACSHRACARVLHSTVPSSAANQSSKICLISSLRPIPVRACHRSNLSANATGTLACIRVLILPCVNATPSVDSGRCNKRNTFKANCQPSSFWQEAARSIYV